MVTLNSPSSRTALSVNTGVVNTSKNISSNEKNNDEPTSLGWLPVCCGANSTKAAMDSDSSMSPSFCVLDGLGIISLSRIGQDKEEGRAAFLDQAKERWRQRVDSNISIGNVSYEYHPKQVTDEQQEELVKAAYDLAKKADDRTTEQDLSSPRPGQDSKPSVTQSLNLRPFEKQQENQNDSSHNDLSENQESLVQLVKDGSYVKALDKVADMIDKDQEERGADDLVVGMETKNRAVLHLLCDEEEQAMYCFHEYLLSKRHCFGEKSTLLSDALNELGITMYARGELNSALSMFHDALAAYGEDAYWSGTDTMLPCLLNNIGCAHKDRGDKAAALSFLQKALVVQRLCLAESTCPEEREALTLNHAITKLNICHIRVSNGNPKVLTMMEDAVSTLQTILGDSNGTVDTAQENVAICKALISMEADKLEKQNKTKK